VGISGIILIAVSLLLSMQDFVIPRAPWEWTLLGRNAVVVCIGLVAAVAGIAVIALFGPRIHIFDWITLQTRITATAGGSATPDDGAVKSDVYDYDSLVGKIGVADTTLRPSGRIEIEGEMYSAETDGSYVEAGRGVKVIKVQGNRIIVKLV
jgi:membrane-bound serine protease (ClpP class)